MKYHTRTKVTYKLTYVLCFVLICNINVFLIPPKKANTPEPNYLTSHTKTFSTFRTKRSAPVYIYYFLCNCRLLYMLVYHKNPNKQIANEHIVWCNTTIRCCIVVFNNETISFNFIVANGKRDDGSSIKWQLQFVCPADVG